MNQLAAFYLMSAMEKKQLLRTNATTIAPINTSSCVLQSTASLQNTNKKSPDCIICFDTQEKPAPLVSLDCDLRHRFHLDCINLWLAKQKDCPQCRGSIKSIDQAKLQLYGRITGTDAQKNTMIDAIEQVMLLQQVKRVELKEELAQEQKKNAQLLKLVPGDDLLPTDPTIQAKK